ncbi:MAG: C13 family peptidase [Paracoccaceae bacterium]
MTRRADTPFARFLQSFAAGVALALPLRVDDRRFVDTPGAVFWTWAVVLAGLSGLQALAVWPVGEVSIWGATSLLAAAAAYLATLHLACLAAGAGARVGAIQARVLPAALAGPVVVGLAAIALADVEAGEAAALAVAGFGIVLVFAPAGVALVRALRRQPGLGPGRRLAACAVYAGGVAATQIVLPSEPMFYPAMPDMAAGTGTYEDTAYLSSAEIEDVYYAQPALLDARLGAIRPGVPGVVEVFALVAGLYPEERVFLREVEKGGDILERRFDAEGRVVRLLSSTADPLRHPLANLRNLRAALAALGESMDPEDVALVYLSSHGRPDWLSTGYAFPTDDISDSDLAYALDISGIERQVVVISACYAGSFLPTLAAPERLAIAAAAADRTSFGCGDDSEWTWFGRAFLEEGLGASADPRAAFAHAREAVAAWEAAEGVEPSLPAMAGGEALGPALDALAARFPSGSLAAAD